jgi:hypothetical protein
LLNVPASYTSEVARILILEDTAVDPPVSTAVTRVEMVSPNPVPPYFLVVEVLRYLLR